VDRRPVVLKTLLKQRYLQGHTTFCKEYSKVAVTLDKDLVGTSPSKAQFFRWWAGELLGLTYAHHCRVLDAMFPGWTAEQLWKKRSCDIPEGSSPGRRARTAD
jgi:hypothetical protein